MSSFYEAIKARYLNRFMPLSSKKKTAELLDFRNLLQTKIAYANSGTNCQVLGFRANDYLRASFHEVMRYSSRGLISYNDFCINAQEVSRSWRYVTLYYSLYFFIISFGRMAGRSLIYLDDQEARGLSMLITPLTGSNISLGSGNYLLTLDKPSDPLATREFAEIAISKLSSKSHETAWNQFHLLLQSWKHDFSGRGLATVAGMMNCLKHSSTVFSETRNRVNYRGVFALKEIDKAIVHLGSDKLSMSIEELDREVATKTGRLSSEADIMQAAHSLGAYFYCCHSLAFRDLLNGQPHPGTHYIKNLLNQIDLSRAA